MPPGCTGRVLAEPPHILRQNFWRDIFSAMAESWKKLKTSNVVSSFIVCSNRNRSALERDLLSYNLLFVGQLYMVYEDKSARS